MNNSSLQFGVGYAMVAVVLGAFAAHGLKPLLSTGQLASWQTAVEYQFYHAFALMIIGLLQAQRSSALLRYSGYLLALGTLLFSGSIYGLCLTEFKWLGPITPIGGTLLISGWFLMLIALKQKR